MSAPGAALFAKVDRAAFAASFAARVRGAGIDTPLSATERFVAGLVAVGPLDREELYWLARISFVTRHTQLERFDALFAAVFGTELAVMPASRGLPPPGDAADDQLRSVRRRSAPGVSSAGGLPWATRPEIVLGSHDDGEPDASALPELVASAAPGLADTPFDLLDADELRLVGAELERAVARWPTRRSRRRRHGRRGSAIAYRPTLRRALRTGGEPIDLVRVRPASRPRPVTALIDVSGSMESYARGYLHVMRALALAGRAEVFAFATSLTRITPALRHHSAEEAIDLASAAVGDRFGGTRLATSLGELLHNRVWTDHLRGGVVVIVSDGCDTDPPDQLHARLARLSRLAQRIVWVNPRLVAPGYEPLVAGMVTALPFCDRILAGHTRRAVDEVLDAITGD